MSGGHNAPLPAHDWDDDEEDWRTPAQWMFDVLLLPGLILLLTSIVFFAVTLVIWGTFLMWSSIAAMIS